MSWREELQKRIQTSDKPAEIVRLHSWNIEQLREALYRGLVVCVRSEVLGEDLLCILREDRRKLVSEWHPEKVIYSLDEILALAKARIPPNGMKAIHEAKKMLGGTFC